MAVLVFHLRKVPMQSVHTWSDAHVEAPTAGSMILAGVLEMEGMAFTVFCC